MEQNQDPQSNQVTPPVVKDISTHDLLRPADHSRTTLDSPFLMIQKATAWVMIASAVLFALVGIMAVWEVFGPDGGDVVMKAFSSLAIIAFAALIVNVSARLMEDHRK